MARTRRVGTERLRALDEAADSVAHALYDRSKFVTHPSVAVKAVISARAQAVVSAATVHPHLVAAGAINMAVANIPPYLTDAIYREYLRPLSGSTERFLRRGTAILIAQHVGGLSAPEAAVLLGYATKTPHTVLPRLGYDLTALDQQRAFHVAVGGIYEALRLRPLVDFQHRRETLNAWRLSVGEAATLREGARLTSNRHDDFSNRWAAAATLWIWAMVTAADPSTHPLIAQGRLGAPSDKNRRLLPQLRGFRLRASLATSANMQKYGELVASAIDSGGAPCPPPTSSSPG